MERLRDLASEAQLHALRPRPAGQDHETGMGRIGRLGVGAVEPEYGRRRQQLRADRPLDPCLEIAKLLGISSGAVDVRLHRARKRLKKRLSGLVNDAS